MNNERFGLIGRLDIHNVEHEKTRLGPLRDGGYVLPKDLLKQIDLLMVFGVSNDVDFELDYIEKYPETKVYLYDHTIESLPKVHANFRYKKVGIGPRQEKDLNTLVHFLEEVDPSNKCRKMLKLDIEFNEWEVIENSPQEVFSQFDLIVIELHLAFVEYLGKHSPYFSSFFETVYGKINRDLACKYIGSIEKLQTTHLVSHAHVNNSLPSIDIDCGGGLEKLPQLVELTLVRRDLVPNAYKADIFVPIKGVDYPNKPDRPDYDLTGNIIYG